MKHERANLFKSPRIKDWSDIYWPQCIDQALKRKNLMKDYRPNYFQTLDCNWCRDIHFQYYCEFTRLFISPDLSSLSKLSMYPFKVLSWRVTFHFWKLRKSWENKNAPTTDGLKGGWGEKRHNELNNKTGQQVSGWITFKMTQKYAIKTNCVWLYSKRHQKIKTNCVQHKFYQQLQQQSCLLHQKGGKTALHESNQQVISILYL